VLRFVVNKQGGRRRLGRNEYGGEKKETRGKNGKPRKKVFDETGPPPSTQKGGRRKPPPEVQLATPGKKRETLTCGRPRDHGQFCNFKG